jgi:hypothetical protein
MLLIITGPEIVCIHVFFQENSDENYVYTNRLKRLI